MCTYSIHFKFPLAPPPPPYVDDDYGNGTFTLLSEASF
jgi:hypothetical protein